MSWLALLMLVLIVGAVLLFGINRQMPDDKPDDLERADDDEESKPSMLGRYWPPSA
jgi:hypothetical protein